MWSKKASEKLLQAVLFVIGSEYISKDWIENVFRKLWGIYVKEILAYGSTVEMYLTERNQKLEEGELSALDHSR